ncbi:hypothetical protein T484DRAFT_1825914 [Baffinella frigidus]|nr:hypothetical protein T484DRAFT_1829798 [Cryptophyta sp. CCMP2293]KAJ1476127.1 hypothetical protein T484DRAFT_1825914 [Cryptophyta sp. CCMP2293]
MGDFLQHLQRGRGADEEGEALRDFVFEVPRGHRPASPVASEGFSERAVVCCAVGEASDEFYETGQVLWPASPLLCYFLLSPPGRALLASAPLRICSHS